MTTDTFIKVQDHTNLCSNFHHILLGVLNGDNGFG